MQQLLSQQQHHEPLKPTQLILETRGLNQLSPSIQKATAALVNRMPLPRFLRQKRQNNFAFSGGQS